MQRFISSGRCFCYCLFLHTTISPDPISRRRAQPGSGAQSEAARDLPRARVPAGIDGSKAIFKASKCSQRDYGLTEADDRKLRSF